MTEPITPKPVKLPPFKAWLASNIPAVYDNTLSYYDELTSLIAWLEQEVVPNVNEAIVLVNELKGYVENYFKNLDVQEEINNKLDEMAESGTLQEIITAYIQANVAWVFDTVGDMKESTNLIAGSYAQTTGYHNINDGGKAFYYIRTLTNEDTVDEATIISLADETLVAVLVITSDIYVEQFGAYGDGTHDDYTAINKAFQYAINHHFKLCFCEKTYIISDTISSERVKTSLNLLIEGNNATLKTTTALSSEYIMQFVSTYGDDVWGQENITIRDLIFDGNYLNKGINIEHSQKISLEHVKCDKCFVGIRLCNVWYGNIDDACIINNCWYGILFDDSAITTSNEVNTVSVGNISIMMPQAQKANFDTQLTETVGVLFQTIVHAVKFNGCVIEHYDYGYKGYTRPNSATYAGANADFVIDANYLEDLGTLFHFSKMSTSNYVAPTVEISNCRIFPLGNVNGGRVGYVECGTYRIFNNQAFNLVVGDIPRALYIYTDVDDLLLDTTNANQNTYINKTCLPTRTRLDPYLATGYIQNERMLLATQDNNIIYHPMNRGGQNKLYMNAKALSINSKNILFDQETPAPVGLIINGDDGKKYMLGTEDGSSVKLIPMNNTSRMYVQNNFRDALWLWNNRTRFSNGKEFYCIDIERTVVMNNQNWYDKQYSYLAIGTSPVLQGQIGVGPNKYWAQCWDVSFNRGVYYNVTQYYLSYDWFKNNDPHEEANTSILVYGAIADRPATPSYNSYYYATDTQKYYYYNGEDWSEITPQVA